MKKKQRRQSIKNLINLIGEHLKELDSNNTLIIRIEYAKVDGAQIVLKSFDEIHHLKV